MSSFTRLLFSKQTWVSYLHTRHILLSCCAGLEYIRKRFSSRCHSFPIFAYGLRPPERAPVLICTYIVFFTLTCLHHVSWHYSSIVGVRSASPVHDRRCAHPSRPSRANIFISGLYTFQREKIVDCTNIWPPTDDACIQCGACLVVYKNESPASVMFYHRGFHK